MSNYDWVECEYTLPSSNAQYLRFQTKDILGLNNDFEISKKGRLLWHRYDDNGTLYGKVDLLWHGTIHIFAKVSHSKYKHYAYDLEFVRGQLKEITTIAPFPGQ